MNKVYIFSLLGILLVFSCDPNTRSTTNAKNDAVEQAIIRSVNSQEAKTLLEEEKEVVLLDVRTPEEFVEGHLEGAKNLDFHGADFAQQLQLLDPDQKYMVYCAVGGRSGKTMKMMEEMGFEQVYNVTEGFAQLSDRGIPVAEGNKQ